MHMPTLALFYVGLMELLLFAIALVISLIALRIAITTRSRHEHDRRALQALTRRVHQLETDQSSAPTPDTPPAPSSTLATLQHRKHQSRQTHHAPSPPSRTEAQRKSGSLTPTLTPTPDPESKSAPDPTPGPSRPTLEERLSTRVFVWLGGIALVLAGAYLVQFSFDRGLLPPAVRLSIGFLFGFALLASAELARQTYTRIAQALAGAGVAVLFAVLLAGVHLYNIIPPTLGFALMAGVTATAVALSLRHGPFVALLGLIGGFATPALIGGDHASPAALFTYLLLLQAGLVIVNRRQGWSTLSLITLLAALAWAGVYLLTEPDALGRVWLGAYLLGTATIFVLAGAVRTTLHHDDEQPLPPAALGLTATLAAGLMLAMLVIVGEFSPITFAMLGLLGIGSLILARLDPRYTAIAPTVAGLAAVTLLAWPISDTLQNITNNSDTFDHATFIWATFAFGLIFTVGAYTGLWGAKHPAVSAATTVSSAAAFLLIARLGLSGDHAPQPADLFAWLDWWIIAAAITLAAALATVPLYWSRRVMPQGALTVNVMALGSLGLAAITVPLALDHPWLAAGWSALALAAVLLRERCEITALPAAATALNALAVAALLVPGPTGVDIGQRIIFNTLLAQYGLPTLTLALAAWRLLRCPQHLRNTTSQLHQVAAVGVGALGLMLLIRHGFHGPDIFRTHRPATFTEWATYSVALLALGQLLAWFAIRKHQRVLTSTSIAVAWLGLIAAIVGPVLLANPLWTPVTIPGWPLVNTLTYAYVLPAALLGSLLVLLRRHPTHTAVTATVAAAALLLVFVWLNMQLRFAFHAPTLDQPTFTAAEQYAYSLAWVLFAVLLAALGIWRRSAALRYASLVIMLLAVAKTFLYDTANLQDLYRVLSFLGLGISLLILGFVYQRFVFTHPNEKSRTTESRPA